MLIDLYTSLAGAGMDSVGGRKCGRGRGGVCF